MKGIQGLIVAAGLGIAAAVLNYFYLHNESKKIEKVNFWCAKKLIARGDKFTTENLTTVGIPANMVGNLRDYVELAGSPKAVVGLTAWRTLKEGSLLLHDDLRPPIQELDLAPDETAVGVERVARSFATSLLKPGDWIVFDVPLPGKLTGPTLASRPGAPVQVGEPPAAQIQRVGPFKLLAIGNRVGSDEVMRSYGIRPQQENVLTVALKKKDAKSTELQEDSQNSST